MPQRQDREENDAAPSEDPKRGHQEAGAHRLTFIDPVASGKTVLGKRAIAVAEVRGSSPPLVSRPRWCKITMRAD
jgi:hypothetical protein